MRKSKRLLSLVLALVMVFSMISGAIASNASTARMSDKDKGPVFSAENATPKGALDTTAETLQNFLPDILALVGEDKVKDALGITNIKTATFADIIGALLPILAKASGEKPLDSGVPNYYTKSNPWYWDANNRNQWLGNFEFTGLTLPNIYRTLFTAYNFDNIPQDIDPSGMTAEDIADVFIKYGISGYPTYDKEKFRTLLLIFNDDLPLTYKVVKNGNVIADKTAAEVINNDTTVEYYNEVSQNQGFPYATKTECPTSWIIDRDGKNDTTNDRFELKLEDYDLDGKSKAAICDKWLSKLIADPSVGDMKLKTVLDDVLGDGMLKTSLKYDELIKPLNGILSIAADNPLNAITVLFPVLSNLIDQLVLPLLIKGNGENVVEKILSGPIGDNLSKIDALDNPTVKGLLTAQFLPLDINSILLNGYTYKIDKNGTMVKAYYYQVPKVDENNNPVMGDDGVQKMTYVYCDADDATYKTYVNGVKTITLKTNDGTTTKEAKAGEVLSFESPLDILAKFLEGNDSLKAIVNGLRAKIESGEINLNEMFPDGLFDGLNYIAKSLVPSWNVQLPGTKAGNSSFRNQLKAVAKIEGKPENSPAIFDKGVDMLLSIINPVLELVCTAAEENIGTKNVPYISQLWEFIGGLDENSILCDAINSVIGNPDAKYKFTLPSLSKNNFYYLVSNIPQLTELVMETINAFSKDKAEETPPAQEPANKPDSKDDIGKLLNQIVALFKDDNGSFKLPQLTDAQKVPTTPVVEYPPRDNMSDEQLKNAMDYAVKQFDIYLSGCAVEGYEYEGLLDSLTKWEIDDPYTKKLFANKTETGPRSFINYIYDNVFTNKIVGAAVTNLYAVIENAAYDSGSNLIGRAVAGVISPQKIARLMGNDCGADAFNAVNSLTGWSGSPDKLLDLNWGFTDGDVSGCIKAIAAPLRIFTPIFEILFSGDTLGLYERLLMPLFETLGFEGTYSLTAFNKAVADGDKDIYLAAVLTPIVNFALGLAEAPMTTIATLIPRLAYLVTSGTLTSIVHGIVEPVQGLLGTVENDIIGTVNNAVTSVKNVIGGSNAKAARAQGDLIDLSKYLDPVNDVLDEVSAVELEVDIVPVLNSVINLVLNKDNSGEPINFKLLSVNWGEVVGYGEVTKLEADSTYSTVAVEHPGDPFVETIHYVISNIQDENNNKAIMGVLSNFNFDAGTQEIIDMVVGMLASMSWADLFWTVYDLLISGVRVPGMASPFVNVNTGDNGVAAPVAFTVFAGFATVAYVVLTVRKNKKEEEQEPVAVK